MTQTGTQRPGVRLSSLTGLRFIAALVVFANHTSTEGIFRDKETGKWFFESFSYGRIGVSFFFVLSGFVLTWSMRPGEKAARFWRRRFLKILPNHVVTWAVALTLLVAVQPLQQEFSLRVAVSNLFLLHTWVPRTDTLLSVNVPSWSLGVELLFYLSFPLLVALIGKIRRSLLWPAAIAAMGSVICVPLVIRLIPAEPMMTFAPIPLYRYWFIYHFPPVRALEFIVGILMARIVLTGQWIRLPVSLAAVLVIADYYWVMHASVWWTFAAVTIVPFALLISAAAAADIEGKPSWGLRSRVMVWLGEISFAFYMVHWIFVYYGHQILGARRTWGTPEALGLTLLALVLSVVAAWLLYAFVERPVMRRWSRPRPPAPRVKVATAAQADPAGTAS